MTTASGGCNPWKAPSLPGNSSQGAKSQKNTARAWADKSFLTFDVCGGLTNQRISLVQGFMLAYLMRATVIMPRLNANGVQHPGANYAEDRNNMVPFSKYYDRGATVAGLERLGVQVLPADEEDRFHATGGSVTTGRLDRHMLSTRNAGRSPGWYARQADAHDTGAVFVADCPFFSLEMKHNAHLRELFWLIDNALVFAPWLRERAGHVTDRLANISRARGVDDGGFNALHVRTEPDWVEHCKLWEDKDAGRDNCMTNTDQLVRVFAIEGVPAGIPVYVAGEVTAASLGRSRSLSPLTLSYELFTKDALVPEIMDGLTFATQRDVLAAIDYLVVQSANTFVGNSVSTFSAMLLLGRERQRHKNPSCRTASLIAHDRLVRIGHHVATSSSPPCPQNGFHYNGGNIPLRGALFGETESDSLPQRGLKWVFTVTSAGSEYAEATRVAVASALARTSLVPICIFSGPPNGLSRWMQARGVRVIFHTPSWKDRLFEGMRQSWVVGALTTSPLYAAPEKMLGTWLRLDVATLGFVDTYVLYADVDVIFESMIDIGDFGAPLPRFFTMGTEAYGDLCEVLLPTAPMESENASPSSRYAKVGNAGVMLINVEGLRRTHAAFISWVFSETNIANGLHFGVYGPGDQGAFNMFYAGQFEVRPWPSWNWKPYWGYQSDAKLLHFHGPKPREYLCHLDGPLQNCSAMTGDQSAISAGIEAILDGCNWPIDQEAGNHSSSDGCYRYVARFLYWRRIVAREPLRGGGQNQVAHISKRSMDRLEFSALKRWPMIRTWMTGS